MRIPKCKPRSREAIDAARTLPSEGDLSSGGGSAHGPRAASGGSPDA
jgi:hypothetical protein